MTASALCVKTGAEENFVAIDNPGERETVVDAHKVKLVANDPLSTASNAKSRQADGADVGYCNGQKQQATNTRPDARRIMHELSSDEFFRVLEESTPEQLQALIHTFDSGGGSFNRSSLYRKVVDVPQGQRSLFSLLLWWEQRRSVYNLVVGLTGLPSLLIFSLLGLAFPAVIAAFFYAMCANVCFCLGAPAEIIARAIWKDKAAHVGPVLFSLGTIFSVILTATIELFVLAILAYSAFTSGIGLRF